MLRYGKSHGHSFIDMQVLLLDEITVDLDVLGRADLMKHLAEEAEERKSTIIYVSSHESFFFMSILKSEASCFARQPVNPLVAQRIVGSLFATPRETATVVQDQAKWNGQMSPSYRLLTYSMALKNGRPTLCI